MYGSGSACDVQPHSIASVNWSMAERVLMWLRATCICYLSIKNVEVLIDLSMSVNHSLLSITVLYVEPVYSGQTWAKNIRPY